ncbi:MAG: hypothetical protein ACK50P_08465, partial [Planctomycetaceae bacterium]
MLVVDLEQWLQGGRALERCKEEVGVAAIADIAVNDRGPSFAVNGPQQVAGLAVGQQAGLSLGWVEVQDLVVLVPPLAECQDQRAICGARD